MADWSELKRLAEAAVEARPDRQYPTFGYAKAMSQLHEKASPESILALIAESEQLREFEAAWGEWQAKTEWIQQTAEPAELGMHRADVLRGRIDQLRAEVERLQDALLMIRNHTSVTAHQIAAIDAAMGKGGHADG